MGPALLFYPLLLVALGWLCLMLYWAWPRDRAPALPPPPRRPHRREPKPFAGLTRKPPCNACAHSPAPRPQAPATPPLRLVM